MNCNIHNKPDPSLQQEKIDAENKKLNWQNNVQEKPKDPKKGYFSNVGTEKNNLFKEYGKKLFFLALFFVLLGLYVFLLTK
jgi:hypothetical protein